MARKLIVSIDAMGGDAGPSVVVSALVRAVQHHPDVEFILHGDEAQLTELVAKRKSKLGGRVTICHAPARVKMEDKPSLALRRGRDTSMWHSIESVKKGDAAVAVSAGNTGALMAMSMFHLGVLEGISRPAIACLMPTKQGQCVFLDVGANVDCNADQLVDFAVMGEAYARAIFGLERPTVGLLNVGEEEVKGNSEVREAAHILREASLPIEFNGFVEGNDIFEHKVDVVVTDGFSGNIAIKTAEGTAKMISSYLRSSLRRSLIARIGAVLASGALNAMKRKLNPRAANGGVFLGLNGLVVKSHGGTDAFGFASAIDVAVDLVKGDILNHIVADRAGMNLPARGAQTT